MGFYSTHIWNNGAIIAVERLNDTELSIRVQAPNEGDMLVDMVMGEFEALCLMQSITSVLTKNDDEYFEKANLRRTQR